MVYSELGLLSKAKDEWLSQYVSKSAVMLSDGALTTLLKVFYGLSMDDVKQTGF